jgi:hypothetical protein
MEGLVDGPKGTFTYGFLQLESILLMELIILAL